MFLALVFLLTFYIYAYLTGGDAKTGGKVIDDRPYQSFCLDLGRQESVDGDQRGESEAEDVLPIQVLPDVLDSEAALEEWWEFTVLERVPTGFCVGGGDGE